MIILHAIARGDKLLIWGEAPASAAQPVAERRSRARALAARPYPYDAGPAALVSTLCTTAPGLKPDVKRAQPVTLWLPTHGEIPLASSALIAEAPDMKTAPRLAP